MALPIDVRQDSVVELMVNFTELRARLLRLLANLRVLHTLQALPNPVVRPPELNEQRG